ncbi:MAG: hypothetical protein RL456_3585, partial [Pseudomonadota bacterium]
MKNKIRRRRPNPADASVGLVEIGNRLHGERNVDRLGRLLVAETKRLLGATRVALLQGDAGALQGDAGALQILAAALPRGEDAATLLHAITPWLEHVRRTHATTLRHGPAGAAAVQQRSCLVAPLMAPAGLAGFLYADVDGSAGRFDAGSRDLLALLASQAGVALANARWAHGLVNEASEALEQQKASADILRVISSSVADTQPVFEKILESCRHLFGSDDTAVLLVDEHDVVVLGAYVGGFRDAVAATFPAPLAKSPAARAIRERCVANYPDVVNDPTVTRSVREVARLAGYQAMAYAPMLWGERGIGAIGVSRRKGSFSARELALLQTFADQAVIAIQNARLFNETKEALEQQAASGEVLSAISQSVEDPAPAFERILDACARLTPFQRMAIFLRQGDQVDLAAYRDNSPRQAELAAALKATFPQPFEQTPMALATHAQQTLFFGDVLNNAQAPESLRQAAQRMGSFSALVAPMWWAGRVVGSFHVARESHETFTAKEVALLRAFTEQAVIAIQNARLFRETNEALAQQTASADILRVISSSPTDVQPVFDAIVEAAVRLLVSESAYVLRTDGKTVTPVAGANAAGRIFPLVAPSMPVDADHNFPSRAILSKAMLHLPDWSAVSLPPIEQDVHDRFGLRSALFLPLMRGDECLGVLVFGRNQPREFKQKEISLAESFRDQAVIAIQNTSLFNETQEALERQTATSDVLQVISESPTNVQPVFDIIAERASTLTGAQYALALRADAGILHLASLHGVNEVGTHALRAAWPQPIQGSTSISSRAVRSRSVVNVADLLAETDAAYSPAMKQVCEAAGFRSGLSVPMLRDQQVIGAITVNRAAPGLFAAKEIDLLQTFARQAVIAVENVRLFNETQEALERQTASADILRVISSSPTNVMPVLDAITRTSLRLLSSSRASVMLREGDVLCIR